MVLNNVVFLFETVLTHGPYCLVVVLVLEKYILLLVFHVRHASMFHVLVLHFLLFNFPCLLCFELLHHLVPFILLLFDLVHFLCLSNGFLNFFVHSFVFFLQNTHPVFDELCLHIGCHPLVGLVEKRTLKTDMILFECGNIRWTKN